MPRQMATRAPYLGIVGGHFFFGFVGFACASAEAAAVRSAADDLGSVSTFEAIEAARGEVCLVFFAMFSVPKLRHLMRDKSPLVYLTVLYFPRQPKVNERQELVEKNQHSTQALMVAMPLAEFGTVKGGNPDE